MRTIFLAVLFYLSLIPMSPLTVADAATPLTPVVLFPAYHLTTLLVQVHNQHIDSSCPQNGTFHDIYLNPTSEGFNEVCRTELTTLYYNSDPRVPIAQRFSDQPGIQISIENYGLTQSAPFYHPFYHFLTQHGYQENKNIVVAGYDARLTPDIGNFLSRSIHLIEQTYHNNADTPVQLVGHSNGPIYIQYLLDHTSTAWKNRYIHGFTSIAGNLAGQGVLYISIFTGLSMHDLGFPKDIKVAKAAAIMQLHSPATYISASAPHFFDHSETIVKNAATGKRYSPADYVQLLQDAHLEKYIPIARHYIGFVPFADPAHYPGVDTSIEQGTDLPTVVGATLPNLTIGQLAPPERDQFFLPGDTNEEHGTTASQLIWHNMRCHSFQNHEYQHIDHFSLPNSALFLHNFWNELNSPAHKCAS